MSEEITVELNYFFQSFCITVHRRERLMNFFPVGEEEKSAMAKGVKLGKQLEDRASSSGANNIREGR